MIILYLEILFFNCFATVNTCFKSAELLFFLVGVPTQINIISDFFTASFKSEVKNNLLALWFLFSISSACIKSDLIIIHTEWNAF